MSEPSIDRDFDESPFENIPEEVEVAELEEVAENTSRKLLIMLVIGGILFVVIHFTPLGQQLRDWDSLAEIFRGGGYRADVYFVVISSFLIMAGVPRLLFCALGGLAFGFWEGLLWSTCASMIGSFIAFRAARWGGREWLVERFGKRKFFARIVHAQPTVVSVFLIRMLPVSNAIINFGLALSHIGDRAFLLGSLFGFLPQAVVAVILGSGIAQDVSWLGATQIGFAGAVLFGIFIWISKLRSKRA